MLKKARLAGLVLGVLCAASGFAQSLKGMSLNGATGLLTVPSGRIGWERTANLALDLGYHTILCDSEVYSGIPATHIAKANLSILKFAEVSGALDFQPLYWEDHKPADFLLSCKFQLPVTKTALAIGGNLQFLNFADEDRSYNMGQAYIATTYAGTFFGMPAETTVMFGKSFFISRYDNDDNVDFGMGFDLVLFPDQLGDYIHWIVDFANFSYSAEPWGADAWHRGILNTGIRIDFAVIKALSKFKFAIDILGADLFDSDRSFSIGGVFGFSLL